ncbi:hypothetical protein C5167_034036 [Papaver somniferum]|uniref:Uncharacterized protein n=1 Tax=Papaver somniferum TaxID=3469 RepID=A0A4Y7KBX1_PAPSO|nr:hypothetical protein C5167_034036 [Papaver somniferum]
MPVMEKLKMFVAQEPVVAASCLLAGVGPQETNWVSGGCIASRGDNFAPHKVVLLIKHRTVTSSSLTDAGGNQSPKIR